MSVHPRKQINQRLSTQNNTLICESYKKTHILPTQQRKFGYAFLRKQLMTSSLKQCECTAKVYRAWFQYILEMWAREKRAHAHVHLHTGTIHSMCTINNKTSSKTAHETQAPSQLLTYQIASLSLSHVSFLSFVA